MTMDTRRFERGSQTEYADERSARFAAELRRQGSDKIASNRAIRNESDCFCMSARNAWKLGASLARPIRAHTLAAIASSVPSRWFAT